jgi:hypothetical protein
VSLENVTLIPQLSSSVRAYVRHGFREKEDLYVSDIIEGVIVVVLHIHQTFPQRALRLLTGRSGFIEDLNSNCLEFLQGTWCLDVVTRPVVERAASVDPRLPLPQMASPDAV